MDSYSAMTTIIIIMYLVTYKHYRKLSLVLLYPIYNVVVPFHVYIT